MKELFVSCEIAFKLKESGFIDPCVTFFWDDGALYNGLEIYVNKPHVYYKAGAATWDQCIQFLWNKFHVAVYPWRDDRGIWYNITYNGSTQGYTEGINDTPKVILDQSTIFNNYNECRLAAINKAFWIIENKLK